MTTEQLYKDKSKCCGCSSCFNSCPKGAISMIRDEDGFLYPDIDNEKCVDCGICVKSCAFQHIKETNTPITVDAAVRLDKERLKKSASGGMFAVIAEKIIAENGVVYGCSMERVDGKLYPMHIKAENLNELAPILGSKYVQSDPGNVFKDIKKQLSAGRKVLFCGTPCQAAGLKGFLKKDWDNLLILDLVCHGVPSIGMFQDYISYTEKKKGITIENFRFRAKTGKIGHTGEMVYKDKNGISKKQLLTPKISSYYSFFLSAQMDRQSCYVCPYSCENRPGDLTIGDFWGFGKKYSDYDKEQFVIADGISVVSVNTEKGSAFWQEIKDQVAVYHSDYSSAADRNPQLVTPSKKGDKYDLLRETYRTQGYAGVEKLFAPALRKYKIKQFIKKLLPESLIKKIRG